jgi:hypothetical protein
MAMRVVAEFVKAKPEPFMAFCQSVADNSEGNMSVKKLGVFWIIGVLLSLYTTFVVQSLWKWFAKSAFHVPEISFWSMYGLVLLVGLFTEKYDKNFGEEQRWKRMLIALDACIPDDKKEGFKEQLNGLLNEQKEFLWLEARRRVLGTLARNTLVLALGFAIHAFVA